MTDERANHERKEIIIIYVVSTLRCWLYLFTHVHRIVIHFFFCLPNEANFNFKLFFFFWKRQIHRPIHVCIMYRKRWKSKNKTIPKPFSNWSKRVCRCCFFFLSFFFLIRLGLFCFWWKGKVFEIDFTFGHICMVCVSYLNYMHSLDWEKERQRQTRNV